MRPIRLPVVRCASPLVTVALPRDLRFVVMLQKAHPAALGFLSRQALREKIRLGQVLIARQGGQRAGFLHHGSLARPEVRVFQIAVTPEARRGGVGRALVECLLARAALRGASGVSLRCLEFLDANRFWRSMGFRLHATEPGAKGTLNVWVLLVKTNPTGGGRNIAQFTFASRLHACPACGAPTVDTWVRGARRLALCPACVATAGLN
jgi:GNAT superfamily N-acetyltransferase